MITGLNPRQKQFCRLYLVHSNASRAYRDSGYAPKDADVAGPRLLGRVGIQAEIARLQAIQTRSGVEIRAHVLEGLFELSQTAEPDSARIRAHELLGKTERMFVDVTESNVVHDVAALREYTPAQLRAMLAEATKQQAIEAPREDVVDVDAKEVK